MGKLIDADRVAGVLERSSANYTANGDLTAAVYMLAAAVVIKQQPAVDAVEVVRCKDCAYWPPNNGGRGEFCPAMLNWAAQTSPTAFCSGGVRKEDENNAEQCTSCDRGPHDCSG